MLRPFVDRLQAAGVRVSLFIEPSEAQIDAALRLGAPVVEFHTGRYAHLEGEAQGSSYVASPTRPRSPPRMASSPMPATA